MRKVLVGVAVLGLVGLGACAAPKKVAPLPSAGWGGGIVTPTPDPTTYTPTTDDYDLTIKTKSKQCFGEAGCDVEITLELGASEQAKEVAADITVKVTGDTSGPIVDTITTDGTGQYTPVTEDLSTISSNTKIKASITDIEVNG